MFEKITKTLSGLAFIKYINSLIDYVDDSIANGDVKSAKYLNITNFIPSNSDFNDYKTPGEYQVQSNTEANTIANLPTSYNDATPRGGVLSVLIGFNAPRTSLVQIYRTYGSSYAVSRTYQRCFYHENSSWTAWREIACTDEVGLLNQANTYTALNTFRANIIVSNGTAAGSSGNINFGISPTNETVQARIGTDNLGGLFYHASTKQPHVFRVGTNNNVFVIRDDDTKVSFSSNNNFFSTVTHDGVAKWLGNANTATKLATARTINGVPFDGTKNITIEAGGGGDVTAAGDNNFTGTNTFNKPITVRDGALAGIGGTITLGMKPNSATTQAKINSTTTGAMYYTATEGLAHFFNVGTTEVASIGSNGNFYISQGLTVGSTLNTGTSNGVIRAGNNESCLYFMGTAENTYYATPNTGNTISYQSAANCYLINCSINNPSSLNMNFSNMNFKATVGSVPYMCKTLTFWLPVSATVPAVTWTFPTGSAVYYPKGVAPTLKANANNIINVIAVVDDTGSFSIQVCDTVVLPYSG